MIEIWDISKTDYFYISEFLGNCNDWVVIWHVNRGRQWKNNNRLYQLLLTPWKSSIRLEELFIKYGLSVIQWGSGYGGPRSLKTGRHHGTAVTQLRSPLGTTSKCRECLNSAHARGLLFLSLFFHFLFFIFFSFYLLLLLSVTSLSMTSWHFG